MDAFHVANGLVKYLKRSKWANLIPKASIERLYPKV